MSGWRVRLLGALAALGLLTVLGRLFQLQVVHGEALAREASAKVRRIELIEAPRGRILDRRGRVLAEDKASSELWVDPSRAKAVLKDARRAERLGRMLAECGFPGALESLARTVQRGGEGERPWLTGLPQRAVYWLTCLQDEYPGLSVEERSARRYPYGALAAHVLGRMGRLGEKDLNRLRAEGRDLGLQIARNGRAEVLLDDELRGSGLFADDRVGREGVERQAEERLRGRRGLRVVSVELAGGRRREEAQIEPAVSGQDVRLTIDADLQAVAERALGSRRGAVVAMDPGSGAVLALASRPGYDANALSSAYAALLKDPAQPLLNRALRGAYPPGSIFKLVTAAAMMEDGGMDPAENCSCGGSFHDGGTRFGCNRIHGACDLVRALEVSCNVYFYQGAKRLGIAPLAAKARAFGFGAPAGLLLGGQELGGSVPSRGSILLSVGQGELTATPLQAARMVSVFANGGRLVRPRIFQEWGGQEKGREEAPVCVGPQALGTIREGMKRAVLSGTASHNGLIRWRVLGKTGTAQVGLKPERLGGPPPHAWFVGYGPEEAPTLAVSVVIEHGGSGGDVATPVAAEIFRAFEGLPPVAAEPVG